jgi:hypothetical protein
VISEEIAAERAAAYGREHFADLGPRTWRGARFPGGWLMDPQGEDLAWRCGVACLAVLDDGRILEDTSSLPPGELIEKYTAVAASGGPSEGR